MADHCVRVSLCVLLHFRTKASLVLDVHVGMWACSAPTNDSGGVGVGEWFPRQIRLATEKGIYHRHRRKLSPELHVFDAYRVYLMMYITSRNISISEFGGVAARPHPTPCDTLESRAHSVDGAKKARPRVVPERAVIAYLVDLARHVLSLHHSV